jgi:hypothetical protein
MFTSIREAWIPASTRPYVRYVIVNCIELAQDRVHWRDIVMCGTEFGISESNDVCNQVKAHQLLRLSQSQSVMQLTSSDW